MWRPVDEQLRPGLPAERVLPVRADLRLDPQPPEDRERPPRDRRLREVEVEAELAPAEEVDGAGRVEERRELGKAVTPALRAERRELGAGVGGEPTLAQSSVPSSARRRRLSERPPGP